MRQEKSEDSTRHPADVRLDNGLTDEAQVPVGKKNLAHSPLHGGFAEDSGKKEPPGAKMRAAARMAHQKFASGHSHQTVGDPRKAAQADGPDLGSQPKGKQEAAGRRRAGVEKADLGARLFQSGVEHEEGGAVEEQVVGAQVDKRPGEDPPPLSVGRGGREKGEAPGCTPPQKCQVAQGERHEPEAHLPAAVGGKAEEPRKPECSRRSVIFFSNTDHFRLPRG